MTTEQLIKVIITKTDSSQSFKRKIEPIYCTYFLKNRRKSNTSQSNESEGKKSKPFPNPAILGKTFKTYKKVLFFAVIYKTAQNEFRK